MMARRKAVPKKCAECMYSRGVMLQATEERQAAVRQLEIERTETATLIRELQLVMAAGIDTVCGSRWINAAGLRKVLERYTEGLGRK